MIYFSEGKKAKSLQELMILGFSNLNMVILFMPTFHDKEYANLQSSGARRSFTDLLEIAQTYFPNTTREELAYVLLHTIPNMFCHYCRNISKVVFCVSRGGGGLEDFRWSDLGGNKSVTGIDGLCFNDINQYAENYINNNRNVPATTQQQAKQEA